MINSKEYGKALFALALEEGIEKELLDQLELISQAFLSNPEYVSLLDTPAISTEEKISLIDEAFCGIHPYLCSFIKILSEKRGVFTFEKCKKEYFESYDEHANILRAEAVTAYPMTEEQKAALSLKLEGITGKNIILVNKTDRSIIGGVRLRYSGKQLDGSIKSHLEGLRRNLSGAVV